MRKWTPEEIAYLQTNKGSVSHEDIASHLNRSVKSINRKVADLQITKKQTGTRLQNGLKKCSKCLFEKPGKKFGNNKTRVDGKDAWCKDCIRWKRIMLAYNISEEMYQEMAKAQNNKCSICSKADGLLFVDHDHVTGKVRELLCRDCNFMLGFSRDNPRHLGAAILYLKRHGIKINAKAGQPLTPEFLACQRKCCGSGCKNCPY